ncbi:MAG TPA: hypothetical protein VK917_08505 [Ilumatobacter sp.]|nr:hypothetical protein [Ilumatobacter sp.]
MNTLSPDLARAVHEDRRRRLVAAADARRVHRELRASRRAERPVRRPGDRLRALVRGRRHRLDAKIARLTDSWLQLDHRAARLLACVADEVDLPAGDALVPGRFSYVGLDDGHRGLLVTTGMPPVTLESATTVLVLPTADLERLARTVPMLAPTRSRATPVARVVPHDTIAAPLPSTGRPQRRIVRGPAMTLPGTGAARTVRPVAASATGR